MEKSALVTGASEGIGRVFATRLASEGYSIMAVARNEAKLRQLIDEIGNSGSYIVADLSTESGQDKVVRAIAARHFDLLVNNAGVAAAGKFTDIPLQRQLSLLNLNCMALVRLSHAYLGAAQSGDALINVSSSLAFLPIPSLGVYCASKAFVTSFTDSLWYEQKSRGIYVMGLCPGITATDFNIHAGGTRGNFPKIMVETPEQVVDTALKALKERKEPTVISGRFNKMNVLMTRLKSRKTNVSQMGDRTSRQ
jgi:uncharacterized protein